MPTGITTALLAAGFTAGQAAFVLFVGKVILAYAVSAMLKATSGPGERPPVARQNTLSGLDPAATWRIIYGRVRTGGTYVFRATTSDNLHIRVGELSIPAQGDRVWDVPEGEVIKGDLGVVFYEQIDVDGTPNFITTPLTKVDVAPAAGQYQLIGQRYYFNDADSNRYVKISYQIEGQERGRWLHMVLVLAYGQSESVDELWFNDEVIPLDANGYATGRHVNYVYCARHLGTPGDVSDPELVRNFPGAWGEMARLSGHTYLYLKLYKGNDSALWAAGVPNISVVMKGRKVYDPRTGLTVWNDNAALCVSDYLHDKNGFNAAYDTEIDEDELIAAANLCDEDITLAGGGTEPRYTCNGIIDTADPALDTLGRLLGAMSGSAVYIGGTWRLRGGAYSAPVLTIDEDDLAGPVTISPILSASEAFSGVKGLYSAEVNNFQPASFPSVGVAPFKNVQLQFTNSASMAQRICKIEMLKGQQQMVVGLPLKMTAYGAEPPDTIALNLARYGFVNKPFELSEMTLKFGEAITLEVSARETDASVYDWASSEEVTVDPAPNTALPNPFIVLPPSALNVTEEIYTAFGFGVRAKAIATWTASPDAQALRYDMQWRRYDEPSWSEHSGLSVRRDEVPDVSSGDYLFRVRAISSIGVSSVWVQQQVTFIGLTAPPGDVTGFTVIKQGGAAFAQWDAAPDLDVQYGGALVVRHTPEVAAPVWEMGVIFDEFTGGSVNGLLPLVTGTYMAKWRDSSGKYSNNTATFLATEGLITGLSTVATSTQAPGFTGGKTDITLDGGLGGLRLTTPPGTGEYLFDTHIDLTTSATRRFELDIAVLSYADGDTIDSRTEDIDTWGSIDGDTNINDCDATVYIRTTNDNPAGSPTWGAWAPFVVGEFTCRAAQFKLVITSSSSIHNMLVSTLTVHVKA